MPLTAARRARRHTAARRRLIAMSLFRNDDDPPSQHAPQRPPTTRLPFSLRNRSVYFWLNVGFVVIILGMLIGASDQTWFFFVAIVWIAVSVVVVIRNGRNRPKPPNLFDD
jgi:uncharacterized ion transporter superfamily protein YfcC